MIRRNLISCIIAINCVAMIFGMRCEDNPEKNSYDLNELLKRKIFVRDLDEIKNTMDNVNTEQQEETMTDKREIKDLPMFDIRFDRLPYKCQTQGTPFSCAEATACTKRSGYYHIKISQYSNDTFLVECDAHTEGGDWTVIQRRHDGSVDFYRTWAEYKDGFGDIDGEFFIGLDKLHALTNDDGPQELLILMENGTNSVEGYAKYDAFQIGNESEKYMLKRTGRYTGTAGDSLKGHIGMKFSTKDQDNDIHAEGSCAVMYMGAWWYTKCHSSNLNGHYGDKGYAKGVDWYSFSGHYNSLTFAQMMIRRRRNSVQRVWGTSK